jgi:hypothetical protein
MVGAIGMVCYGGPVDAPAEHYEDEGWADFNDAVEYLDAHLNAEHGTDVYTFNDVKGRTAGDAIGALSAAADLWDRIHGGAA